jgi:hypothetical protein
MMMGQQCPPMMLMEYFLSFSNHTHVFVMVAFAAIAWENILAGWPCER